MKKIRKIRILDLCTGIFEVYGKMWNEKRGMRNMSRLVGLVATGKQIQDFEKRRIRGFGVWLGLGEQFTKLLVHSRKPTVNKFIVVITVLGRIAVLLSLIHI